MSAEWEMCAALPAIAKVKPHVMALITLIQNAGRKFDAGDFTDAAALYKDALELSPNCLEALIGLGTQLYNVSSHDTTNA